MFAFCSLLFSRFVSSSFIFGIVSFFRRGALSIFLICFLVCFSHSLEVFVFRSSVSTIHIAVPTSDEGLLRCKRIYQIRGASDLAELYSVSFVMDRLLDRKQF